jgi:hypothetical protein
MALRVLLPRGVYGSIKTGITRHILKILAIFARTPPFFPAKLADMGVLTHGCTSKARQRRPDAAHRLLWSVVRVHPQAAAPPKDHSPLLLLLDMPAAVAAWPASLPGAVCGGVILGRWRRSIRACMLRRRRFGTHGSRVI